MRLSVISLTAALMAAWGTGALADPEEESAPERTAEAARIASAGRDEREREAIFIEERLPVIAAVSRLLDRIDEKIPLTFYSETSFFSDWLNEGVDSAGHGLQIEQHYFTEMTKAIGNGEAGVGFEYFQIDTTGGVPGPSTVERDFTVYMPITWGRLHLEPGWTYMYIDGADDTQQIQGAVSLDVPLRPSFEWNSDYDDVKGNWFQWGLSHDVPVSISGERLAVLTGSVTLGMDNRKSFDHTGLTNIDFGLDCEIPLMEHLSIAGVLHFSKSLNRAKDEEGNRIFTDIIPWGGLTLLAEF